MCSMSCSDPPSINRGQIRHCHWALLSPHCPLYCFSFSRIPFFVSVNLLFLFNFSPSPLVYPLLCFSVYLADSTSLHQSTLQHESLSKPPTLSWINCQFTIHETSPQFPKRSERWSVRGKEKERETEEKKEFNYFSSLLRTQTSCPLSSLGN